VVCLFSCQISLVLIASTHGGMARLSRPAWSVPYRDGLSAHVSVPVQVHANKEDMIIDNNY